MKYREKYCKTASKARRQCNEVENVGHESRPWVLVVKRFVTNATVLHFSVRLMILKIETLEHRISAWVNTSSNRKYRIHNGDLNVVMFAIEQFSENV